MTDPFSNQFFVGWGTLALINAGLAQGKGGSGLAWFLASLLLGPIATLLIVITPVDENDDSPLQDARDPAQSEHGRR